MSVIIDMNLLTMIHLDWGQLNREDDWKADLSKCVEGSFAAVHSQYGDKHGLSIIKVTRFVLFVFKYKIGQNLVHCTKIEVHCTCVYIVHNTRI